MEVDGRREGRGGMRGRGSGVPQKGGKGVRKGETSGAERRRER